MVGRRISKMRNLVIMGKSPATILIVLAALVLCSVPVPVLQGASRVRFLKRTTKQEIVLNARSQEDDGFSDNSVAPLVPALFIFGDSTVDSGNNNFLPGALARANMPPYGRDFDSHLPTGRFSNGRIAIDYIALRLGLPFIPSFLGLGGALKNMLKGVNFASAGAGILYQSGSDLGQHIPLTQQIQQASDTFQAMAVFLGQDETHTRKRISDSLFYISIGNNDYIHLYLQNISGVKSLHSPWRFNKLLIDGLVSEITNLYNLYARNIVFIGMGPLGCAPRFLYEANSAHGECVEEVNSMIIEYNYALSQAVLELNQKLPEARFMFCDVFYALTDIIANPQSYGFQNANTACCGWGKYGGWLMCGFPEMACADASSYVWWDEYHPTSAVNEIVADNLWSGKYMNICSPFNLKDFVSSGGSFAIPSPSPAF